MTACSALMDDGLNDRGYSASNAKVCPAVKLYPNGKEPYRARCWQPAGFGCQAADRWECLLRNRGEDFASCEARDGAVGRTALPNYIKARPMSHARRTTRGNVSL